MARNKYKQDIERPTEPLTKQQQLFFDNGMVSYDPARETKATGRTRGAIEMAKAETWAVENGYSFDKTPDGDADESWMSRESTAYKQKWSGTAWGMIMYDETGKHVQSLWGCYGDTTYARVVRAELAMEEMATVDTKVQV